MHPTVPLPLPCLRWAAAPFGQPAGILPVHSRALRSLGTDYGTLALVSQLTLGSLLCLRGSVTQCSPPVCGCTSCCTRKKPLFCRCVLRLCSSVKLEPKNLARFDNGGQLQLTLNPRLAHIASLWTVCGAVYSPSHTSTILKGPCVAAAEFGWSPPGPVGSPSPSLLVLLGVRCQPARLHAGFGDGATRLQERPRPAVRQRQQTACGPASCNQPYQVHGGWWRADRVDPKQPNCLPRLPGFGV